MKKTYSIYCTEEQYQHIKKYLAKQQDKEATKKRAERILDKTMINMFAQNGRPAIELNVADIEKYISAKDKKQALADICSKYAISKATFYNKLKQYRK